MRRADEAVGDHHGSHDDDTPPEITSGKNGTHKVKFRNDCVVRYDSKGHRERESSECSHEQIRKADEAMASYRREQSAGADDEHPWSDKNDAAAPPRVVMGKNHEGEVIFTNRCVVYYDAHGKRTKSLPDCSKSQREHADKAMKSYRKEQGM